MVFVSLTIGLLVVFLPFLAASTSLHVFEKLDAIPAGWSRSGNVSSSQQLQFRIAVKLHSAGDFEQHVIDISTPGHHNYGKHMSREELKRTLRPSAEATRSIIDWLKQEGISDASIDDDGDWINFRVVKHKAERLLDTQ